MDAHRSGYSVVMLCRALQISRSGYYASKTRTIGVRRRANQQLLGALMVCHEKYPALGLDSLYHLLHPQFGCSRSRVHRLMKRAGLHSERKRAYRCTTNSRHAYPVAPNLLRRNFKADLPNRMWVGDITYVPTDEGWLYTAIVKDLCTKKVVSYAFSNRIDTNLTIRALRMAVQRQHPKPGLIFHSDRGVQYASTAYQSVLRRFSIQPSMSRKGDPYDNAVAENFFSCLKCELIYLHHFQTREQAMASVFAYIEAFYNSVRPHSGIGWLSPNKFADSFTKSAKSCNSL